MNRQLLFSLFFLATSTLLCAQKFSLSGLMKDGTTGEPLIGATVSSGEVGTVTDYDGSYLLELEKGSHTINFSYVGYKPESKDVQLDRNTALNISLNTVILNEVVVTANIAIERETPVAFSNIPSLKIQEELSGQELPMLLNSTPGAYATQSGGGDGDARITIRGFNQRNIAVMIDGIPVNDMETGWVFWSNWFGLDLVTQTMQVQRGLGASKLSIPSVGGTINILTKGIEAKKSLRLKEEVGNDGYTRTTIGLTSGRLKNGWAVSAAGSYKRGDGWVDGNFTKGWFYYFRIDKSVGKHLFNLQGYGAPQEHGQRPFPAEIGLVDSKFARKLGVPEEAIESLAFKDMGRRYNEHWGFRNGKLFNTRRNFFHKPQINFRHSWQPNERLFLSNILYLSIGHGGGTAPENSPPRNLAGQYDIDKAIEANQPSLFNPDGLANHSIRSSMNNHFWYGLLSTLKYKLNDVLTLSGGVDARYYKGDHFRRVEDLFGATAFRSDLNELIGKGDKFDYNYSGFVRWGGLFGLLEYKKNKWSAFINTSTAVISYKSEDYRKARTVTLQDTSFQVNINSPVTYRDITYTVDSKEAQIQHVDWINLSSVTFKTGASYKIDKGQSVFFNTGYLSKPQRFNNVINVDRFGENMQKFEDYDNEKILSAEVGYSFKSPIFSANLNGYYTVWKNKPLDRPPTVLEDPGDPESDRIPVNISGIDALHKGIELDFAFKPVRQLSLQGLASIADWRWTSAETAVLFNGETFEFDATDVHVGDAAQLQLGGLVRFEPLKGLYFKLNYTWFGKNYADFQPETLKVSSGTARTESWKMPNYKLFDLHAGYNFKINKTHAGFRFNILNLFDTVYISDARNNDSFNSPSFTDFDAKSASVHFGQGRRWTAAFQISF